MEERSSVKGSTKQNWKNNYNSVKLNLLFDPLVKKNFPFFGGQQNLPIFSDKVKEFPVEETVTAHVHALECLMGLLLQ